MGKPISRSTAESSRPSDKSCATECAGRCPEQGGAASAAGTGAIAQRARAAARIQKWGPALLPAPICAERRICRCSSALVTRRSPLLDPGSPAQASLPSVDPNPKTGSSCFRGPSWTNPLSRRLRPEGHRVRARKTGSSGASSGWSNSKPKLLLIACRWRSDLPPLPSEEGWDFRPDHPFLMNLAPSSLQAENAVAWPVDNGDIAHKSAISAVALLFPRSYLGSCPNPLPCPTSRTRLPRRPQPAAARGGADHRRAGADAGRRGHRQDRRADRAPRPPHRHPPRLAEPDPRASPSPTRRRAR